MHFDGFLRVLLLMRFSHWKKALQISGMLSTQFCIPERHFAVPQIRALVFAGGFRKTGPELLRCSRKSSQSSIEKALIGTRICVLVYQ
jgi:hypothetical protein